MSTQFTIKDTPWLSRWWVRGLHCTKCPKWEQVPSSRRKKRIASEISESSAPQVSYFLSMAEQESRSSCPWSHVRYVLKVSVRYVRHLSDFPHCGQCETKKKVRRLVLIRIKWRDLFDCREWTNVSKARARPGRGRKRGVVICQTIARATMGTQVVRQCLRSLAVPG